MSAVITSHAEAHFRVRAKHCGRDGQATACKSLADRFGLKLPVHSTLTSDSRQAEAVPRLRQLDRSLNSLRADIAAHIGSVAARRSNRLTRCRHGSKPFRGCTRAVKRFNRDLSSSSRAMILGVEFIDSMTSNLDEYECVGECRDRRGGAVVGHAHTCCEEQSGGSVWHLRQEIESASICAA
jgi:hypothetical protein